MTAAQQAETIVLLTQLTGMSLVDAAYAVIPNFDHADFAQTAMWTMAITEAQKRLDRQFKETHS